MALKLILSSSFETWRSSQRHCAYFDHGLDQTQPRANMTQKATTHFPSAGSVRSPFPCCGITKISPGALLLLAHRRGLLFASALRLKTFEWSATRWSKS